MRSLLPELSVRRRFVLGFIPLVALVAAAVEFPRSAERLAYHDNDRAAGQLVDGQLTLRLEIGEGMWHPNGDDRPGVRAFAWAESGERLTVPGPLIRVPVGTLTRISVRNRTDSTLVVRGLGDTDKDTLVLAPGASAEVLGRTARAGNRMYFAQLRSRGPNLRADVDGQAVGAFIVDAPGASRVPEHVLVISGGNYHRDSTGRLTTDREIFAVNGRPWPHSQRLRGTIGDSLRFRILNASSEVHPMHLHGAYYRVEAMGDLHGDTALVGEAQRQVVTQVMVRYTTMTMAWVPERPGTWLFHCHLTFHVTTNIGFGSEERSNAEHDRLIEHGPAGVSHDDHVEKAMGGLMLSIEVPAPAGWQLPTTARRSVQLVIPQDSQAGDRRPAFAPSVVDERGVIRPLRRRGPGAPLILRVGEPTAVRVVNESRDHVAIHWHGIELESYYDGVVGLGGTPDRRMRAIPPGGSFDALMTPPRAGTFIYHTHLGEVRQQEAGLYGALIVLSEGEEWNPSRDHLFVVGTFAGGAPRINGDTLHPALELAAGAHRFRLINITTSAAAMYLGIVAADGARANWTPLAKDGMDLPASRRGPQAARRIIAMGETYDFEVSLPAGRYDLEMRNAAGVIRSRQPFTVLAPP